MRHVTRLLIEAHPYHPVLVVLGLVLFLGLALGGCVTTGAGRPTTALPVCEALVGPILYNSKVPTSRRHAGPDLAQDLALRNRVGKNLRCPAYR